MGIQGTASKPMPCQRDPIPQIPDLGASASNNPKKQSIPCFFYQRGQCLKRDKCPFMHIPQPIGLQPMNDRPRYTPSYIPVGNRIAGSMPSSDQSMSTKEHLQNDNDNDESSRESTPGFDVLVGDNFQRCDYPNENDFVDELGLGEWSLYPATEFSYHPSFYEPVANLKRETESDKNEHKNHYETMKNHVCPEQKKTSPEKFMDRKLKLEKRVRSTEETPEEIDSSGLCHHRLKQRRLDNPNSIVSRDGHGDPYFMEDCYFEGERYHGRHCNDDQLNFPPRCSMSARQQSRIKHPVRKSPDQPVNEWSERQLSRERQRDRLSSTRPARYRERQDNTLKQKLPDEFVTDARNFQSQFVKRADSKPLNFRGHCSKDQQRFPPGISTRVRLQDRTKSYSIKSPDRPVDEWSERQLSRERQRCRLSSTKPTSYWESHNDRLKRKIPDSKSLNFAGPKSLAELKAAKKVE